MDRHLLHKSDPYTPLDKRNRNLRPENRNKSPHSCKGMDLRICLLCRHRRCSCQFRNNQVASRTQSDSCKCLSQRCTRLSEGRSQRCCTPLLENLSGMGMRLALRLCDRLRGGGANLGMRTDQMLALSSLLCICVLMRTTHTMDCLSTRRILSMHHMNW